MSCENASERFVRILGGWENLVNTESDKFAERAEITGNLIGDTLQLYLRNEGPFDDHVAKSRLVALLDACYRKFYQICNNTRGMCKALMDLIPDPWGSPILQSIMYHPDQVSHEACVSFCSMEHPNVLKARIEILMESRHDELAYNLTVCCIACGSPGGTTFYKEAVIVLNYRLGKICQLTKEMSEMSCHDGVKFVERLLEIADTSKLALAECLTQIILVQDLVWATKFCCTATLMKLWTRLQVMQNTSVNSLRHQVKKLAALALTSAHQYLLVDILYEQYGVKLMSLYIEIYIQAITMDINHLENLKLHEEHTSILEMETHLATVFSKLSMLFVEEHCAIAKECVLTAFTLEPTRERLSTLQFQALRVQEMESASPPLLSPVIPTLDVHQEKFIPRTPCHGECYCEEKGQCRLPPDLMQDTLENANIAEDMLPDLKLEQMNFDDDTRSEKCWDHDDFNSMYPIYSPVIDSGLPGVSIEVLKDLVIVLESARAKCPVWDKEWSRLGQACEEYLETELEVRRIILESSTSRIPFEMQNRHFQRRTYVIVPAKTQTVTAGPSPIVQHSESVMLPGGPAISPQAPVEIDNSKLIRPSSWTPISVLDNLALPTTFKALDNSMSSCDANPDRPQVTIAKPVARIAKPVAGVAVPPITLHKVTKSRKTGHIIKINRHVLAGGGQKSDIIVNSQSGHAYIVSVPFQNAQIDSDNAGKGNKFSMYASKLRQADQSLGPTSDTTIGMQPSSAFTVVNAPKLDFTGTIPKMGSELTDNNCQTVKIISLPEQLSSKRRADMKAEDGRKKPKKMFASKKRKQDGNMWFSIRNQHGIMEYKKLHKDTAEFSGSTVPLTDTPRSNTMHVVRNFKTKKGNSRTLVNGEKRLVIQKDVDPSKLNLLMPSQQYPTLPQVRIPAVFETENMQAIVVESPIVPVIVPAKSPVPAAADASLRELNQLEADSPVNATVVIVEQPAEPTVKVVPLPKCVNLDSMPIIVSETSPVVILSPMKNKFRITNPVCVLERLDAHVITRELQAVRMRKLEREKDMFCCDQCNKPLCSAFSLKRHLKAVHNLDVDPFTSSRRSSASRKKMKSKCPKSDVPPQLPKCIEFVAGDTATVIPSMRETQEMVIEVKDTVLPPCSLSSESGGPQSPCLPRPQAEERECTDGNIASVRLVALNTQTCSPEGDDGSPRKSNSSLTHLRQFRLPKSRDSLQPIST